MNPDHVNATGQWSLSRSVFGAFSCLAFGIFMGSCTAHFNDGILYRTAQNVAPLGLSGISAALKNIAEHDPWTVVAGWVFLLVVIGGVLALFVRGIMLIIRRNDPVVFIVLTGLAMLGSGIFSTIAARIAVRRAAPKVVELFETFKDSQTIYFAPANGNWAFFDPAMPDKRVLIDRAQGLVALADLFGDRHVAIEQQPTDQRH